MKDSKVNKILIISFMIIGSIFLGIAGSIYTFADIPVSRRIKVPATILAIEPQEGILVSYFVKGDHYTNYLHMTSNRYYHNQVLNIYYDKDNPNNIMSNSFLEIVYIIGAFGGLILLVAFLILYFDQKRKKEIDLLKSTGNIINAKFISVKRNHHYEINGKNPYNIVCEYKAWDGKLYRFNSENIWYDPIIIINDYNIKSFPVYVDRNNYKKYYMDIELILNKKDKFF